VHQPRAIQPLNVNHLWEMSTSFMNRLTFSPFNLPAGCVRVLFHTTESVFGISFDDSDQEVRVTELLRFPPDLFGEFIQSPGTFSYNSGAMWSKRHRTLVFVKFDWPECGSGPKPQTIRKRLSFRWQSESEVWMDPTSGRVVFIGHPRWTSLVISDFALS